MSILIILIGTIFITIFNYFNIVGNNFIKILSLILPLIALGYAGFKLGKLSSKHGYLEGIKIGVIFVILITIINLIFNDINWYNVIYYFLIIVSAVLGSMIGINKKKV